MLRGTVLFYPPLKHLKMDGCQNFWTNAVYYLRPIIHQSTNIVWYVPIIPTDEFKKVVKTQELTFFGGHSVSIINIMKIFSSLVKPSIQLD